MTWARRVGMVVVVLTTGCVVKFAQRSPWDVQQLQTLSDQLEQFRTLAELKSGEAERLREGRAVLVNQLSSEIDERDVSVGFDERGLVVRVVDRVLFDSGKAQLRQEAYPVLDKVASTLSQELADQPVGIEGHTDNEPIKRSGWKDNWQLSLARARSVLTYLVRERGVDPSRVAASGYGEYRPIASNETTPGRRLNRRVEIVVLPRGTAAVTGPTSAVEAAEAADTTIYQK